MTAQPELTIEDFARTLAPRRSLIGLDLGTKTIGVAVSDLSRMIASGVTTIARTKFKEDAAELLRIVARQDACGLVIGLPLNLDGSSGPRVQSTRSFVRNLAPLCPLPVLLWDERLSTVAAERMLIDADASRRRRAEVIDKVAATIILQSALDRLRHIEASRPRD